MNQIKNISLSSSSLLSLATNWQIIVGFLLYGASSILYLKLLAGVDVTKAYPALVAYMALVILFLGALFLKEPLSISKILGAIVIVLGIFLVSR